MFFHLASTEMSTFYCVVVAVMLNPPLHPSVLMQQNPPFQPAEPLHLPGPYLVTCPV